MFRDYYVAFVQNVKQSVQAGICGHLISEYSEFLRAFVKL
jgi:hypothetical protein